MNSEHKMKVFLVDDDALFLKLLEIEFLEHTDFSIQTFATGEACIDGLSGNPDVIILDYHLNGIDRNAMNGMETLDKIKAFNSDIPVVILSSQDLIDLAVKCMNHKALDFVVKSDAAFIRLKESSLLFLATKQLRSKMANAERL